MIDRASANSGGLDRLQRRLLVAAGAALVLLVIGALLDLRTALQAYLAAYLFVLGVPLGSMAFLMIHHLTGGRWGVALRPALESGAMTMPVMAVLFLPVLLGAPLLYPWAGAEQHDAAHADNLAYLNLPGFIGRAVLFLAAWSVLAVLIVRWTRQGDREPQCRGVWSVRARRLSAAGLIIYVLTASFALIDWAMSLDDHWYSSIYGLLFVVNHGVMAIGVGIVTLAAMTGRWAHQVDRDRLHDLGNWLLTMVILWAYVSFSQFFIIWSGHIPEEVKWYVPRTTGGWGATAVVLIIAHFAIPFLLLLHRPLKRALRPLVAIAVAVLVMQLINVWWVLVPSFGRPGHAIDWRDPVAVVLMVSLWLAAYAWMLARTPVPVPAEEGEGGQVAHA